MSGGLHDIKKRIKSVRNTRQVTKAMEAVAASKMRQSTQRALISRDYSSLGWQLINNLAKVTDEKSHPLLKQADQVESLLLIFITSDKGLCGGFNAQVIRQMQNFLQVRPNKKIDIIVIGRKGQRVLKKLNKEIIGAYEGFSENPGVLQLRPIAQTALTGFISGQYDQVHIVFTDFKSAISQQPVVRQLLPLESFEELVGQAKDKIKTKKDLIEYLFEPDPKKLLDAILPRLLEIQIYQAMLESAASEHSARMMAMRSATDAASEMINELTLTFNQARQAAITQEIAEISAGSAALEER